MHPSGDRARPDAHWLSCNPWEEPCVQVSSSFPALLHHLFRFHHPEKARRGEEQGPTDKAEGKDLSPTKDAESKADWDLAHSELLELEGVDLKVIFYAL